MSCHCTERLGEECREHYGYTCSVCGTEGLLRAETMPCEGHDRCPARICEDCLKSQACIGGMHYACPEHLAMVEGEKVCDICRKDAEALEAREAELDGLDDNRPHHAFLEVFNEPAA